MDKITEQIVNYANSFSQSEMTPAVTEAARDRLFDTIACAIAGSDTEAARIVARIASRTHNDQNATVFGFGTSTSPELAALANAMMVRTHDFNDAGGGHPSDMISGILAAGEITHASGSDVLAAITLAYEVNAALFKASDPFESGFDQGMFQQVGTAVGAARLLRLNDEQLANAASLALVPNIPLRIAREGELSMMKGCGTAFATRNGIFAAMLAHEGFTSCPQPYAGFGGLWESVTDPFEIRLPVEPDGLRIIQKTTIKPVPAVDPVICLLDLIPKIRAWTPIEDIATIHVEMAERFVEHLADESKYDPKTRESADHSVPYLLAAGLVDGSVSFATYEARRIADPALRPLMRKITVGGNPEYTKLRKRTITVGTTVTPASIRIRDGKGREFFQEVMVHKGHMDDPMTREDLYAKFDAICKGDLQQEQIERIGAAWWNVAQAADIREPIRTLTGFREL